MKRPKDYARALALAQREFGFGPAPKGSGLKQEPMERPRCAVCSGPSNTQSQSLRHPEPRLLCWPCSEEEYLEMLSPESRALLR